MITNDFEEFLSSLQDVLENVNRKNNVSIPNINSDSNEDEKRKAFTEALKILCDFDSSLDDNGINNYIDFFTKLYGTEENEFRHMYSDACEVMFSQLDTKEFDNGVPFGVVNLENNITMIKEVAERTGASERTISGLKKLQDHISLEKLRMRYMAAQNKHNKEITEKLSKDFKKKIKSSLDNANTSFKEQIKETKDSLQKNYITILGIFAAVVIAFMSASMLSSSVLESMNDVSIYRLSFTMLVLGFFIFNLLCALFMFLSKISNANAVQRWFVITVDSVFVVLIVLTIIARFIHILG